MECIQLSRWVMVAKPLEPSLSSPRIHIHRKLESAGICTESKHSKRERQHPKIYLFHKAEHQFQTTFEVRWWSSEKLRAQITVSHVLRLNPGSVLMFVLTSVLHSHMTTMMLAWVNEGVMLRMTEVRVVVFTINIALIENILNYSVPESICTTIFTRQKCLLNLSYRTSDWKRARKGLWS